MKFGTPNPNRHWHRWSPQNNDVKTTKTCECGATRRWDSRKWVVRKAKPPELAIIRAGLTLTQSKLFRASSRDGRTNIWQLNCPKCGKQWTPNTTMLAQREETCPRCGHHEFVNYNA